MALSFLLVLTVDVLNPFFRLVGANELGGHAEMAISKSKEFRGGCETPSSEPGMDLLDLWDLEDDDTNGYVFGDPHGGGDGTTGGQHPPVGPQVAVLSLRGREYGGYVH